MDILLQIIGAVAIIVAGRFLVLFGGLGNSPLMFFSGWAMFGAGIGITTSVVLLEVFGMIPSTYSTTLTMGDFFSLRLGIQDVTILSVFIASVATIAYWRKIFN